MKIFENVAQMKLARLREGQLVQTKAYYGTTADDTSGAATYKVLTAAEFGETPDEWGDHTLANGNVAQLKVASTVDADQYGADPLGNDDATLPIGAAIAASVARRSPLEVFATGPLVVGSGLYATGDLELPDYTSINLRLTTLPGNTTTPCFYVNGRDVDLNKTTITPRAGFTGIAWEVDTSRPGSARQFGRLKCELLTVDGQNADTCQFGRAKLSNASDLSEASFWDCSFLSLKCAKGFVVDITSQTDVQYWNANKVRMVAINFIDDPFSIYQSGGTNLEASENEIQVVLQPGNRTADGGKVYGGLKAARNKISGVIFDWQVFAPTGTYAIFERGFGTTYEGINGANISPGTQANGLFNGTNGTHQRFAIVPSDGDDRNVLGTQDNMLAFGDKKPNFTVTQSDPFDSGSITRALSLDTYNVNSWTGLVPADRRTVTIEHPRAQLRHISAAFQLNAVPRYVLIEFLNTSGVWTTAFETSSNYSTNPGYYAGVTTGQGFRADGVRYTFGDPVDLGISNTEVPPDTTLIRLTNLFAASVERTSFDAYQPVGSTLLTDNFITMTNPSVPGNVTARVQTRAIAIRDETGTVIGHCPIYDVP